MPEPAAPRTRWSVRATALLLLVVLGYLCAGTLVFAAAAALLASGVATSVPWLHAAQKNLYDNGFRPIWQNQPGCVEFDEILIYRPRDGQCRFRAPEFDTLTSFRAGARQHGTIKSSRPGVVVLGDSHAMGWGVQDDETFAALLQASLRRPVHNLAVSSYAQARQLIALERSGLLESVDTVVIQYNDNDIDENRDFEVPTPGRATSTYAQVTSRGGRPFDERARFIWSSLRYALKVPFGAIKERWRPARTFDFAPHYAPLARRLAASPALRGKRVLVFYVNKNGTRFRNFPSGPDASLPHVRFVDLAIPKDAHFDLDEHLTPAGHRYVARRLAELIAAGT